MISSAAPTISSTTLVILVNLAVTIAYTFDGAEARCGGLLLDIEAATVAFFCGGLRPCVSGQPNSAAPA